MERALRPARATLILSIGMAVSGTAGLFSALSGQPTLNVVFVRCLFGALALIGWVLLRRGWKGLFSIERRRWPLVLVSGICLIINWLALFEAFHRTSIGFATIIYHLQPFWIVLAGGILLNEQLSKHKIGWVCVAFVGLVFTILPKIGDIQTDRNWLTGVGLAFVASLFYAATTLTTRAVKGVTPDVLSAAHCLIGCVVFLPFFDSVILQAGGAGTWGWLVGLGVIHTGIVYVLLYSAYPGVSTTAIAAAAFLNPAVALMSDFFVFARSISAVQAVGLAMILLAGLGVNLGWPILTRISATRREGSDR